MASLYPAQVSAAQVGTYFLKQYYQILTQQPELVHQFYSNASSMSRFDGTSSQSATGMLEIHNLVMCQTYSGIEITTIQSLESWNGGVLVTVSGYVQLKEYNARKRFVQTFFLAPQEKGYFVLNDIFCLQEEEHIPQHPATSITHDDFENKLNASNPVSEPVSDYMLREEIQPRDFLSPVHAEENETVDMYSIPETQQQVSEADERNDEALVEEPTPLFPNAVTTMRDRPPTPAEDSVGEQPKATYASILRAKGLSGHSVSHAVVSSSKTTPGAPNWHHFPQSTSQQSQPAVGPEQSNLDTVQEAAVLEVEGEARSVYVGNLSSSISESDLEQEFKNFGRIKPNGVNIRSHKDSGVFYAFVEFEDAVGVQNALQASPLQINGRMIHVEGRRPNSSAYRGGRRGRGRGGYQQEAPRGRFGARTFSRGSGQDISDRDYNSRPRGNGYLQRGPRQDKGILGSQAPRNGHNFPDA